VRHARAGEDAAGEIAVFADTAVCGLCFQARTGAERPERGRLASPHRAKGGCRDYGKAKLCQHGAGVGALKKSR
jgi:hypothetical protein